MAGGIEGVRRESVCMMFALGSLFVSGADGRGLRRVEAQKAILGLKPRGDRGEVGEGRREAQNTKP